jgi:histidinol-phosphatase (PHP family)
MLINDHFHSLCSFDADYPLTALCAAAAEQGVEGLCLTDHCDLINEHGEIDDSWSWENEDEQLRSVSSIHVRKGVELGQAILRPEAAERVLSEPGIDFVLGSMHNSRDGQDFYYMDFQSVQQCQPLIEGYLQDLLALSRTDYFDSLAHLTYPLRYMRVRAGLAVDFRPYDDLVHEILKALVHRGKALELNTSGYRNCGGEPMPPEYILRQYRDLGGDLITMGTDAHEPKHMADGLGQGMELLRTIGFRYITLYENRQPQQILL